MQVLSWNQKRKRLLRQLAGVDTGVARRVIQVETAWEEASQEMAQANETDTTLQEFTTADDFLQQPKPPITDEIAQVPEEPVIATQPSDVMTPATAAAKKTLASYLD